ncbi:probable GPI-anchored adhesin-like protein PGA55 [Lingula anatina]|uniref:Probable GPI-anchored adhesin-like protein PGA55 n=1 Tax=Lingula anatina TaxID=7574 RepID=A0A1S3HZG6_LINAN|nr:probable GPI-anchored adhesin-like protein PGA55 [Lingula anatina]|eukprot:XP_013391407.1 probable GPI-anchored adhesin-like protein PGA55 [Lingula anatina]
MTDSNGVLGESITLSGGQKSPENCISLCESSSGSPCVAVTYKTNSGTCHKVYVTSTLADAVSNGHVVFTADSQYDSYINDTVFETSTTTLIFTEAFKNHLERQSSRSSSPVAQSTNVLSSASSSSSTLTPSSHETVSMTSATISGNNRPLTSTSETEFFITIECVVTSSVSGSSQVDILTSTFATAVTSPSSSSSQVDILPSTLATAAMSPSSSSSQVDILPSTLATAAMSPSSSSSHVNILTSTLATSFMSPSSSSSQVNILTSTLATGAMSPSTSSSQVNTLKSTLSPAVPNSDTEKSTIAPSSSKNEKYSIAVTYFPVISSYMEITEITLLGEESQKISIDSIMTSSEVLSDNTAIEATSIVTVTQTTGSVPSITEARSTVAVTTAPVHATTSVSVCNDIPFVINAERIGNDTGVNSTVTYVCGTGYRFPSMEKEQTITCTENGTWSKMALPPCSVVICQENELQNITNVNTVIYTEPTVYNTLVTYYCKNGTVFPEGGTKRIGRCSDSGQWVPNIKACGATGSTLPKASVGSTPPLEAEGAEYIGSFAIIILVAVCGTIVLLDLLTLQRHLRYLHRNVRHTEWFRRCFGKKAKKRKTMAYEKTAVPKKKT